MRFFPQESQVGNAKIKVEGSKDLIPSIESSNILHSGFSPKRRRTRAHPHPTRHDVRILSSWDGRRYGLTPGGGVAMNGGGGVHPGIVTIVGICLLHGSPLNPTGPRMISVGACVAVANTSAGAAWVGGGGLICMGLIVTHAMIAATTKNKM